ncbi:tudor domain-containing protein 1 [Bombina bombina]|uniref:tudor domain-containing protein 1 n=1 Tax=Bombina bombina TaxID=8345 RepID=UPI00235A8C1D|nr:tudor domain-containing protein 1 [Bombina bombina]
MPILNQKRLQSSPDNIMSVGYNANLFNSLKPVPRVTSCHHCGLHGSRRCSQCRQTYYCSLECQKKDWPTHSIICRPASQMEQNASTSPSSSGERAKQPKLFLQKSFLRAGRSHSRGIVLEFSSPSNFFVQVLSTKSVESLHKLMVSLSSVYKNSQNLMKNYEPAIGEVCVAKYSQDKNWYRVLVQSIDNLLKTAQVIYLDFGNQETVKFDDLQQMHKEIELCPPIGIKCYLANVIAPTCGWTPECLIEIRRMLLGQKISFTIIQVEQEYFPCYAIDIVIPDSGINLKKWLLEKGYAINKNTKSKGNNESKVKNENQDIVKKVDKDNKVLNENCEQLSDTIPPPLKNKQWKAIDISVGDVFMAVVTEIQSPGYFFCQQVKNSDQLTKLLESMNEHYKKMPAVSTFFPTAGDVCSAQFSVDNQWYRVSVLEYVSKESVLIGYIDFGNLEVLPVSKLRPMLPSMESLPIQAIKCSLAGVNPVLDTWTMEATTLFKSLVMNKILTVSVVNKNTESALVDLRDVSVEPELVISRCLVESKVASPREATENKCCREEESSTKADDKDSFPLKWVELPVGRAVDVTICMLCSPGEFYCQRCTEADFKLLHELNISLVKYCQQLKSRDYIPKKGDVCCAFFAGDGNWYRALVADIVQNGTVKVHFLDYGNFEDVTVDKLHAIPSKFLELPFQMIKCCLAGVKPVGEKWDRESTQRFQECVAGIQLQARAISKGENGFSVVLIAGNAESPRDISDILIAQKVAIRDKTKEEESEVVTGHLPVQKFSNRVCNSPKADEVEKLKRQEKTEILVPKEVMLENPLPLKEPLEDGRHTVGKATLSTKTQETTDIPVEKGVLTVMSVPQNEQVMIAAKEDLSGDPNADYPSLEDGLLPSEVTARFCMTISLALARLHLPGVRLRYCPCSVNQGSSGVGSPGPIQPSGGSTAPEASGGQPSGPGSSFALAEGGTCVAIDSSGCPLLQAGPDWIFRQGLGFYDAVGLVWDDPVLSVGDCLPLRAECASFFGDRVFSNIDTSVAHQWISIELPLNEAIQCRVLKVFSPDLFFAFPIENRVDVGRLQQVMLQIAEYSSAEMNKESLKLSIGGACCARFTEDGQWYRAVILDISESVVQVAYADYGNVESLPVSSLIPIKASFLQPPVPIIRCGLSGVTPVSNQWSESATDVLMSLLLGCDVAVMSKSLNNGTHIVSVEKLTENGVMHIHEKLVSEQLAEPTKSRTKGNPCKDKGHCCCQDLKTRVEKLEQILLHILNQQKASESHN